MWVFRILSLLLPFALLGLVEIGLRLAGYGYNPEFFKRVRIGEEDFFVQNEDFSRRFFPRETMRNPGPVRFRAHKAPGTYRIFILGESAAMGDPVQSFAPDRYLEMLLREKYPGTRFEVINVAFTAINSHVILPIARECAEHEGDLWIIYMGNNEMVGPFGAATVFGSQAPARSYIQFVLALQKVRTGQWLMEQVRRFKGQKSNSKGWGGMAMFLNNQVPPDDPRKKNVYRNFEKNVHDIATAGVNSGAKVLLNTVGVNLTGCPPFASATTSDLPPGERAQFEAFCAQGKQASDSEDYGKAAELYVQASQLDSKPADLQFHLGLCRLRERKLDAARQHLQLACDNDTLPFRADSRINEIIRAEGEKLASKGLILFDAAGALASGTDSGICGSETFYEHVHFGFEARYRLGRAWAERIESLLPVSQSTKAWISRERCDEMLGLSPWNHAQVVHFMIERIESPPLSSQENNSRRKQDLERDMASQRGLMNTTNADAARRMFLKELERRPEDHFLHQEFAVFLELTGDLKGAEAEWQRFCQLVPQDSLGYYQAGRLLTLQQHYPEAEAALRTSLSIRPGRTDAWMELGNALALQKKYSEALARYSVVLSRDPHNGQALLRQGKVLGYMNRHPEAIESYRAALEANPSDGLSHYELGLELLAAGDLKGVGKEFADAARLSPDRVAARFNYGTWLMNEKHFEEARMEFEAVVRLEPDNAQARKKLATLQALTKTKP